MNLLSDEEFKQKLSEKVSSIEDILKEYLPANPSFQKTIFDAMEYSVMAGGKRLRPMIMGEVFSLFSGRDKKTLEAFMAALEMIHTYSLVHDDLPAMDNDEYRRGKKTTHAVFGEDMGILAGDALLNYAYETAVAGTMGAEDKIAAIRAMDILSKKSGIYGMVGGQVVDVEKTGSSLTKEELDFVFRLKTGALLEASFMVGGVLAGADEKCTALLEKAGRNVGMAFQIQDDILDITSTTEVLGKPVGSDDKNEKQTYVSLYGMEEALRAVERYSKEALEILEELPGENIFLDTLINKLINRKK